MVGLGSPPFGWTTGFTVYPVISWTIGSTGKQGKQRTRWILAKCLQTSSAAHLFWTEGKKREKKENMHPPKREKWTKKFQVNLV